jgi:hypothetical protein
MSALSGPPYGTLQRVSIDAAETNKLQILNWILFAIYSATSVTLAVLTGVLQPHNTVPLYDNLPNTRAPYTSQGAWTPHQEFLANFPVGAWTPVYLACAAVLHLICASPCYREKYLKLLVNRRNPLKWIEYIVTFSLMHIQVAQISGIMDVHLLLLIMGLVATTTIMGFLGEISASKSTGSVTFALEIFGLSFLPFVFEWAVILSYFITTIVRASASIWVYVLIFGMFGLDLLFQFALLFEIRRDAWWIPIFTVEVTFMVLSFVSKQFLAWITFAGTFISIISFV